MKDSYFSGIIRRCGQYYYNTDYDTYLSIKDRVEEAYSLFYGNYFTECNIDLVSDNKDLVASVLQPQNNVLKANCTFVSGEFKIYGWLRPLNAAYVQTDKTKGSKVSFKAEQGFYSVMFSDPINLKEIEPDDKILRYLNKTYGISLFQKQLSRVYPKILEKRPKKLLSGSYHFRPYRSL